MMGFLGLSGLRRWTQSPARREPVSSLLTTDPSSAKLTSAENLALEVDTLKEDLVLERDSRGEARLHVGRAVLVLDGCVAWSDRDGGERSSSEKRSRIKSRATLGELVVEALEEGSEISYRRKRRERMELT